MGFRLKKQETFLEAKIKPMLLCCYGAELVVPVLTARPVDLHRLVGAQGV